MNPVRAGLVVGLGCGVSQWVSRGHGVYGMWVGEWRKVEDEDEMGRLLRRVRAFGAGVAIGSAGGGVW